MTSLTPSSTTTAPPETGNVGITAAQFGRKRRVAVLPRSGRGVDNRQGEYFIAA